MTSEEARRRSSLVKNRHRFSTSESISGGKLRSVQAAEWRRLHPTQAEQLVRNILARFGIEFIAEYPIQTIENMTQYFDVFIPAKNMAIEVDGSHDWHNHKDYYNLKMEYYDHIKFNWAYDKGIKILVVQPHKIQSVENQIKNFLEGM